MKKILFFILNLIQSIIASEILDKSEFWDKVEGEATRKNITLVGYLDCLQRGESAEFITLFDRCKALRTILLLGGRHGFSDQKISEKEAKIMIDAANFLYDIKDPFFKLEKYDYNLQLFKDNDLIPQDSVSSKRKDNSQTRTTYFLALIKGIEDLQETSKIKSLEAPQDENNVVTYFGSTPKEHGIPGDFVPLIISLLKKSSRIKDAKFAYIPFSELEIPDPIPSAIVFEKGKILRGKSMTLANIRGMLAETGNAWILKDKEMNEIYYPSLSK